MGTPAADRRSLHSSCTRNTAVPPPHGSHLYENTKATQRTRIFFFTCSPSRELSGGVSRRQPFRGGGAGGGWANPSAPQFKWCARRGPQIFSSSRPISGDCAFATLMLLSCRGKLTRPRPTPYRPLSGPQPGSGDRVVEVPTRALPEAPVGGHRAIGSGRLLVPPVGRGAKGGVGGGARGGGSNWVSGAPPADPRSPRPVVVARPVCLPRRRRRRCRHHRRRRRRFPLSLCPPSLTPAPRSFGTATAPRRRAPTTATCSAPPPSTPAVAASAADRVRRPQHRPPERASASSHRRRRWRRPPRLSSPLTRALSLDFWPLGHRSARPPPRPRPTPQGAAVCLAGTLFPPTI